MRALTFDELLFVGGGEGGDGGSCSASGSCGDSGSTGGCPTVASIAGDAASAIVQSVVILGRNSSIVGAAAAGALAGGLTTNIVNQLCIGLGNISLSGINAPSQYGSGGLG